MPDCTRLLNASADSGDSDLFTGLYAELKKVAAGRMAAERQGGDVRCHWELAKIWLYRAIEKKT